MLYGVCGHVAECIKQCTPVAERVGLFFLSRKVVFYNVFYFEGR